jgi:hypothetical protein
MKILIPRNLLRHLKWCTVLENARSWSCTDFDSHLVSKQRYPYEWLYQTWLSHYQGLCNIAFTAIFVCRLHHIFSDNPWTFFLTGILSILDYPQTIKNITYNHFFLLIVFDKLLHGHAYILLTNMYYGKILYIPVRALQS